MARSSRGRPQRRRRETRRPPSRRRETRRSAAPKVNSAETLLLGLARDITLRATTLERSADVEAIAVTLLSAYAPEAPLATALREDWLRSRNDKTGRLALAWAREQLRLALSEVLQRARAIRSIRADGNVDTLAWLWLAACEALAHEPESAASDRAHALVAFLNAT